jgi:nanoRNase/pAp phosphatase (c-di-AMP/oligoRNAs hydrolase)
VEVDRKVATALLYGVRSDTRDLGRGVSAKDIDACMYFYNRVLFRLLSQIEHPEVPRDYLSMLERAISNAQLYKDVVTLDLGHVEHLEIIAEMADLIVRTEGVKWVLSVGEFVGDVYFSLRTKKRRGSADRIAQKMVAGLGTGGGHEMLAGGKVPADEKPHHSHRELAEILVTRFLKALKRRDLKAENLLSYSQEAVAPRTPDATDSHDAKVKMGS